MKIVILIAVSAFFLLPGWVFAQEIDVELSLESREYFIGDWISLTVTAIHDGNIFLYPPDPGEKIGELYFLGREDLPAEVVENRQINKWILTVSAYDTGYYSIPAIPIAYVTDTDSTVYTAFTDSAWVFVVSAGGDTLTEIHDIKPPLGVKRALEDYLPYIMISIVLVLFALGYWLWKKYLYKPPSAESGTTEPEIDPYEHAMKRMVDLKNRELWQKGFVQDYFSMVTEIVKEYVELEFKFNALEMTTEEFIEINQQKQFASEAVVKKFLRDADLVKFAKFLPQPEDCENSIEEAYSIIKEARANARRTETSATVTDMIDSVDVSDKTPDSNVNIVDGDEE